MEDRFIWIDNNRYVIDRELWKKVYEESMFTYVAISYLELRTYSENVNHFSRVLTEAYRAFTKRTPRKYGDIVILYESDFMELMRMASEVQFNPPVLTTMQSSIENALQEYYHQIPEGKKGGVFGVVTKDSDGKLLTNAVIAIKAGDKLEVGGYIGKKWGGDLVYGLDAKFFF